MTRSLIMVVLLALVAASVTAAATPKPDAHDRALAQQLAAKVESLSWAACLNGFSTKAP